MSGHAGRVAAASILVLAVLATGIIGTPIGLSLIDQFRVKPTRSPGSRPWPNTSPAARPTRPGDRAHREHRRDDGRDRVDSGRRLSATGGRLRHRVDPVDGGAQRRPATSEAFKTVDALRDSVRGVDPPGPRRRDGRPALDTKRTAVRDQKVIIPAILLVVLAVLYLLLRAALAPLVLIGATAPRRWPPSAWAAGSASIYWGSRSGQHHAAVRIPVPGRAGRGLHDLLGDPGQGGDADVGAPAAVSCARGVGHRCGDHQRRAGAGRGVLCAGVLPLIALTQLGIIVGLGILLTPSSSARSSSRRCSP